MKFSWLKTLTYIMLTVSVIMAISSNSWFFIWLCMELNLMAFIPLFKKMNMTSANSMMKYFITQSLSSNILLFSMIMTNYNMHNETFQLLLFFSLWIKMGLFPFHTWFFQISENLNWNSLFLLNTMQKIIPLWLTMTTPSPTMIVNFLLICNLLYSMVGLINQTSLRWMLCLSSMSHSSWMLLSINNMNYYWQIYLMVYIILNWTLYKFLCKNNWNTILSINNSKNSMMENMNFLYVMLNFMGFPPMLGFLVKLIIITTTNSIFMLYMFIMNNIMSCYMYIKFFLVSVTSKNISFKMHKQQTYENTISNFYINIFMFFMVFKLFL